MVLETSGKGEGIQVEIRCDSKTEVDQTNGEAIQEATGKSSWECLKATAEVVEQGRQFEKKGGRLAVHTFREHSEEADVWAEKRSQEAGGRGRR